MQTEIVQVQTSDQIKLHGALHTPSIETENRTAVDAVLCLHGAGSNFYGSSTLGEITQPLVEQGIAVLRVNTRGHDWVYPTMTRFKVVRMGTSYEIVSQCGLDIHAWVDYLSAAGYARIGLLGHSLGAIKAVYASSEEAYPQVTRLIAISPPRLSYSYFRESPEGPVFFADYQKAKSLVDSGQGDQLIEVQHPLPFMVTAKGYINKYGPKENYNILKFLDRVGCPALYIYGELELQVAAFAAMPESIKSIARAAENENRSINTAIVPEANHLYAGKTAQLAEQVYSWLCD